MRCFLLGSGSKGNSCIVQTRDALMMIDNGLSGKEAVRRLEEIEIHPEDLNGIIVSHEHNDHVSGVGILARKYHLPVYVNHGTYQASKKKLNNTEVRFFESGDRIEYNDLKIQTFSLPHDAADPVGFTLSEHSTNGHSTIRTLGYVTDLGQVTTLVKQQLKHVDGLIIEANHDEKMLLNGPYPWRTKQRIRSRYGHISNDASAQLIEAVVKSTGIRSVMLAHLSQNNNDPALARDTIAEHIERTCNQPVTVQTASQFHPTEEIIVE